MANTAVSRWKQLVALLFKVKRILSVWWMCVAAIIAQTTATDLRQGHLLSESHCRLRQLPAVRVPSICVRVVHHLLGRLHMARCCWHLGRATGAADGAISE